jgi:hypothetical protein
MARRKPAEAIKIDVEPFLSIMAIVLKLISLILVVIVMRIAMNPKAKRIIALSGLWSGKGNIESIKAPTYLDCHPDYVAIYPGNIKVTWDDMQRPMNPVEKILDKVQGNRAEEYIVVMARPKSIRLYRAVRALIGKRPIDVGYDAVDADFEVNWDEARKALAIKED